MDGDLNLEHILGAKDEPSSANQDEGHPGGILADVLEGEEEPIQQMSKDAETDTRKSQHFAGSLTNEIGRAHV